MKYKIFIIMLCMVFLIGSVSAFTLNSKNFNKNIGTYGKYEIKNLFGIKLKDVTLTENTDKGSCSECYAVMDLTLYKKDKLIDDFVFYRDVDGKWIETSIRSYQFFIWEEIEDYEQSCSTKKFANNTEYQDCSMNRKGSHYGWVYLDLNKEYDIGTYKIKLLGYKKPSWKIDWQIKTSGIWTEEWAIWGNISEGDEAEVILNAPVDGSTTYVYNNLFNATANVTGGSTLVNMSLWTNETGNWVQYNETSLSSNSTKAHGKSITTSAIQTDYYGMAFKYLGTSPYYISSVQAVSGAGCDYSKVYFYNGTDLTISGVTSQAQGGVMVFENNYTLQPNVEYRIECNTPSGDRKYADISGYPHVADNVNWTQCSNAGGDCGGSKYVTWNNIESINISENPTSTTQTFNRTITDGIVWNVQACDSDGDCGFATSNFSLSIDSTAPALGLTSPKGTVTNNGTILLNTTATDTNLQTCWYEYNLTNTTYTCNSIVYFNTSNQKNITVWANDSVGNINSTFSTFNWNMKINVKDALGNLLSSPDITVDALGIDTTENPLIRDSEIFLNGIEERSLLVEVTDNNEYSKDFSSNITFRTNQSEYNITMNAKSIILNFYYYNGTEASVTGYYNDLNQTYNFTDSNVTEVLTSLEEGVISVYWGFNETHPMNYTQFYEFDNTLTTEQEQNITVLENGDTYAYIKVVDEDGNPIEDAIIENYYSLPANPKSYQLMGRGFTEADGKKYFVFDALSSVKTVINKEGYSSTITEIWNPQDEAYESTNPKTFILKVGEANSLSGLLVFTKNYFYNRTGNFKIGLHDIDSDSITFTTTYRETQGSSNRTIILDGLGLGSFTLYPGNDFASSGTDDIVLKFWRGSNVAYWGEYTITYRDVTTGKFDEPSGIDGDSKKRMLLISLILLSGVLGLIIRNEEDNIGYNIFLIGGILLGVVDFTNYQWLLYTCVLAYTLPIIRRYISE